MVSHVALVGRSPTNASPRASVVRPTNVAYAYAVPPSSFLAPVSTLLLQAFSPDDRFVLV